MKWPPGATIVHETTTQWPGATLLETDGQIWTDSDSPASGDCPKLVRVVQLSVETENNHTSVTP